MRIIVAGQGKSGTTALYYKIKMAMPDTTELLFEPTRFHSSDNISVLAKALVDPPGRVDFSGFDGFEKKILIIRDPRDNLISRLLYRTYNFKEFCLHPEKVEQFLEYLKRKENNTHEGSVVGMIQLFDELISIKTIQNFAIHPKTGLKFHDDHQDYFVLHYEDFVSNNLEKLEDYLGLSLGRNETAVECSHDRVVRTKGTGDWRNWFTESDIEYFKPLMNNFVQRYGYDTSWSLNENPYIDPKHSSNYVARLVAERCSERL